MSSHRPRALTRRILSRLAEAELCELNPHLRCDVRIAWITVSFAARGDPQPDVGASYAVLGLHPQKVWPAIVARKQALLGAFYAEWWGGKPSDQRLPPKKPVQSVKIAAINAAWKEAQKSSAARGSHFPRAALIPERPAMASHATAYRETSGSARENLSPHALRHLVRYSGIPLPQRHLILAALEISENAGVVIWSSVKSLSVETKMSERTIYHRRRRMLKLDLWERIRDPYTWDDCPKCGASRESRKCASCGYEGTVREFRRPPTFRLKVEKLASWPRPKGVRAGSYKEYKNSADYPAGKKHPESGHRSTSHSSPSNEVVNQEVVAPKPALVAPSAGIVQQEALAVPSPRPTHRSPEKNIILEVRRGIGKTTSYLPHVRRVTRDERVALFQIYMEFKKEMSHELALAKACSELHLSLESGSVALKIMVAKKQVQEEREGGPRGPCAKHPNSGLTQWGTCWGCYVVKYSDQTGCECALHPGSSRTSNGECSECYAARYPSGCAPQPGSDEGEKPEGP